MNRSVAEPSGTLPPKFVLGPVRGKNLNDRGTEKRIKNLCVLCGSSSHRGVPAGRRPRAHRRGPGAARSLPAGAAGGAQDRAHAVDLTAAHLEHVHVGVPHEHGEPDADARLDVGEDETRGQLGRP